MDLSETKNLPATDYAPAELDAPSKVLLGPALAIERDGWFPGDLENNCEARCAWTGITDAAGSGSSDLAHEAGMRFASALGFSHISQIFSWNDSKSKEQVLAKLRAVALGLA